MEMKVADGDMSIDVKFKGYASQLALRPSVVGGMCVIMAEGKELLWWEGLDVEESMASERVWILEERNKRAFCGIYLRTNGPKNGAHYQQNLALLEHVKMEALDRQTNGYACFFMGDFNAHVATSDRFQFERYPHPIIMGCC